jgi:N-acetyl sugar amidotransferase
MTMVSSRECARCVMDSSDPDISFDADGVCNHCRSYDASALRRPGESVDPALFGAAVARIRESGRGKAFDAVVGVSGGVDSTYCLWLAKTAGLRVLALHVDGGWNSEIAVGNIHRACQRLGVELVTEVIDWEEMRDLQAAFFRASVPNYDLPQDHAFFSTQPRKVLGLGVNTFISGRNYSIDAVMPKAWVWSNRDGVHLRAIHRMFGRRPLRLYPVMSTFEWKVWFPRVRGYRDVHLLDSIAYDREAAKAVIAGELGWRDYGGKHYESVLTRFGQAYYLPVKFGFDKRRAHLSGEIVSGRIGRDSALQALRKPLYSASDLETDRAFVLRKLGFSLSEWEDIMAAAPRRHEEFPNGRSRLEALRRIGRLVRAVPHGGARTP